MGALCTYVLIVVYTVCSFHTSPLQTCEYIFEITVYLPTYLHTGTYIGDEEAYQRS